MRMHACIAVDFAATAGRLCVGEWLGVRGISHVLLWSFYYLMDGWDRWALILEVALVVWYQIAGREQIQDGMVHGRRYDVRKILYYCTRYN